MSGRLPARLLIAAILIVAVLMPVFGGAYLTTFLFTLPGGAAEPLESQPRAG